MEHSLKNYDLTLPSSTFPQNMLTAYVPLLVSLPLFCFVCVSLSFSLSFSISPLLPPSSLYLFLSHPF